MARKAYVKELPTFKAPGARRSRNMAAIKSVDTKPELYVRGALYSSGFRYRLHSRSLPGRPDITLRRFRTVVLVQGCFWHGHKCRIGHIPRSNSDYWRAKIDRNVTRDARNTAEIQENGWRVAVIRECTLEEDTERLVNELCSMKSRSKSS